MFNDGSAVLSTVVVHDSIPKISDDRISQYFEVSKTCEFICRKRKKKIGLQIPNYYIPYTIRIKTRIEEGLKKQYTEDGLPQIFILGNSPKSGLDIVAYEHVGCDLVIVYGGFSCLHHPKKYRNTEIFHVFGHVKFDFEKAAHEIKKFHLENPSDQLFVVYEPLFENHVSVVSEKLKEYSSVVFSSRLPTSREDRSYLLTWNGFQIPLKGFEDLKSSEKKTSLNICLFFLSEKKKRSKYLDQFLYSMVGEPDIAFTITRMRHLHFQDSSIVVKNVEESDIRYFTNTLIYRSLRKRYYSIELVKTIKVFGLVITTTPSEDQVLLSKYLKRYIHSKGRKCYVFHISTLSPPKLANFLEIDAWINVRCSCGQVITLFSGSESEEYYKPILTPFEVFYGLQFGMSWSGEYVLEVPRLLDYIKKIESTKKKGEKSEKEVDFSFISGQFVSVLPKKEEEEEEETEGENMNILDKREWKGLKEDEDVEVMEATVGRSGIGAEYSNEKKNMMTQQNKKKE